MPHLRGELEQRKTSRDRMMKEEEGRETEEDDEDVDDEDVMRMMTT